MCGLTAGLLIASTAIAAGTATSQAVIQKKQSNRQRAFELDRQNKIDSKAAQENAFYRSEYYADPMRTAEGANALKQIREYNQRMTDISQNRGHITGATHEQSVAQQGQAMNAYASAVSNIRAQAERTRRAIGQQWMQAQNVQFQRQTQADAEKNALRQQSMTNAINNVGNFGTVAQGAISSFTQYAGGNRTVLNPEYTEGGNAPRYIRVGNMEVTDTMREAVGKGYGVDVSGWNNRKILDYWNGMQNANSKYSNVGLTGK